MWAAAGRRCGGVPTPCEQGRSDEDGANDDDGQYYYPHVGGSVCVPSAGGESIEGENEEIVKRQEAGGGHGNDLEGSPAGRSHSQEKACGRQGGERDRNNQPKYEGKANAFCPHEPYIARIAADTSSL